VLSQLLDLAASRVTATQLLDLAGAGPVRAKFGFDDDDVERLRDWSVTAGARWGLDAEHREAYGLQHIGQGTWRAALDRLLLGVAMEDDVNWLGTALPVDDVDSGDIDLVGRFAELVDRVDHAVRLLEQKHTVPEWMWLLAELVDNLGTGEQPWQAMQVRNELDEVAETAADTDVELALADVTALLAGRLAGRPTRASFRTGTLTVCTLVPMRSVPHRVVCLLGMDDDAFPRRAIPDGDDVLARDPRTGERDPRSEDRQLFLDAVCAAAPIRAPARRCRRACRSASCSTPSRPPRAQPTAARPATTS
jgi:exodeoxyribonuclease V gamma subunit